MTTAIEATRALLAAEVIRLTARLKEVNATLACLETFGATGDVPSALAAALPGGTPKRATKNPKSGAPRSAKTPAKRATKAQKGIAAPEPESRLPAIPGHVWAEMLRNEKLSLGELVTRAMTQANLSSAGHKQQLTQRVSAWLHTSVASGAVKMRKGADGRHVYALTASLRKMNGAGKEAAGGPVPT